MATDPRVETIRLLTSIDAKMGAFLELAGILVNRTQSATSDAPTVDLDGQYGDPVVKAKSPKDWAGENMTGRRFSECPAEYLDQVADRTEHFARKNAEAGDDTKAGYDRRDAARARGWAARLRAGWKPAEPAPMAAVGYVGDDFAADAEPRW